MQSVMNHFSRVPRANIQRSTFDRSHGYKTTFDADYLVPVLVDEALPGDTFNCQMNAFARIATPIKPIMDNIFLDSFFFAVPYRLVWTHWENFMGAKASPTDTTTYVVPHMHGPAYAAGGVATGSLADYMGIPIGAGDASNTGGIQFNALHIRAYNLIWNEYFRDGNLQTKVTVNVDDGPDNYNTCNLLKRGKRHDYFTSCLPWPQRGDAVTLPLGTSAPVLGIGKLNATMVDAGQTYRESDGTTSVYAYSSRIGTANDNLIYAIQEDPAHAGYPGIYADLTTATAATINSIRQAFQLQVMAERDARGGSNRYIEIVYSHFGVVSDDARLQRPEYLGGGESPINIHPVTQTTPTPASGTTTPQGNMSAFGTCGVNGHGFTKSFTEHCLILGLVAVRSDLTYSQGLNRMWSRQTRYDYFWPALAHLGEQAVLNKEIYCVGKVGTGAAYDEGTFAYQERYAEYKYFPSIITGLFRPAATNSLKNWHCSYQFTSLPALGDTFIQSESNIDQVIVTTSEPHFIFDAYFKYICARPMPVYSVPGLVDHF
ncbi:MAG: major capsid protein [Arizlama microvirus]|nr:MAG: major capsid protein [Arizlama microvirus]